MKDIDTFYSESMLPQIRELMNNGATPTQIAACLHVSKQDLHNWLMNPDEKFDGLRREVELGLTAAEAYWEKKGQQAILGQLKTFRESTYKLFMQNRFKWAERSESQDTIKTQEQLIPDELLQQQIDNYLKNVQSLPGATEAPPGTRSPDPSQSS